MTVLAPGRRGRAADGQGRGTPRRVRELARTEGVLLWRFGVVAAVLVVTVLWSAVLVAAPAGARDVLLPAVLLVDVAALGLLFVPSLLVLERAEGVEAALRLTRVRTAERVGVRVGMIALLACVAAAGVCLAAGAPAVAPRLLGVALLSVLFGLMAFAVTGDASTVTDVLPRAASVAAPLLVPALVHLLDGSASAVLHVSPVTGAVDLLRGDVAGGHVGWLLLWITGLAAVAGRTRRRPRRRSGGEARGHRRGRAPWPTHPGTYRAGRAVRSHARADRRTLLHDGVLVMLVASVPLLVVILRLIGSLGVTWAERRHGIALGAHLPLLEALMLVVHTPVVFGSLTGLLLLEDRDAGLLGPLAVTRAGLRMLLAYRLGATAVFTAGALAVLLPLDGIAHPAGAVGVLATAGGAGAVSVVPALLMAATATNRVQGVAVLKMLGLPLYLPLATWAIAAPVRWAFAPLPTSWLVWAAWATTPGGALAAATCAVVVAAVTASLLTRVLRRTVHVKGRAWDGHRLSPAAPTRAAGSGRTRRSWRGSAGRSAHR